MPKNDEDVQAGDASDVTPDPEIETRINEALREWKQAYVYRLSGTATRAHLAGQVVGRRKLRITAAISSGMKDDALAYGDEYGRMLTEEGASMINGEKKYWLRDTETAERQRIFEIIKKGLEEGKSPGATQALNGNYPKGSIAADLKEYFDGRKSHAATVARSETSRILNTSSGLTYKRHGVETVTILDNEGPNSCARCKEANGQHWPVDYYLANIMEHPDCVRTANPDIPEVGGETAE